MKIFLATFDLEHTRYMGKTTTEKKIRLVWAEDEEGAREKISLEYDYTSPGDDSYWARNIELEEAL